MPRGAATKPLEMTGTASACGISSAAEESNGSDAEMEQSIWIDKQEDYKREILNQAIDEISGGRISPIQSTLDSPWGDITQRQRTYYIRKAKEVVNTTLSILTPGQEELLWECLSKQNTYTPSKTENKNMERLLSAYNQAASWHTRRQILSLFVNDFSKLELQKLIPGLTVWRIDEARKHVTSEGKFFIIDN